MLKIYRIIGSLVLYVCCCIAATSLYASTSMRDFTVKGIFIDLRTQVMTIPALKNVVKKAAAEGINTLIIEYEATFPFDKHATLCNSFRFTRQEVIDFVQYCSSLGVDVIPLQNCFGHCEYILQHDRYAALRENKSDMSQVCPLRIEEAKQVFGEIFREIALLHPSSFFHIGADETRLLGNCKYCKQKAIEQGVSSLFSNYIKEMCRLVLEMGKKPVIWADMVLQYPEVLKVLPAETVIIDWNYGWEPNHFGNVEALIQQGFRVWGASALRSSPDNLYLTQWNKHFENLETFIPFARKCGYEGMINTSWSTSGRYGYIYDNNWEVIELQPIRQVYPLSGFDILQRAYADALKKEYWNAHTFILNYGKEHFGFDMDGQRTLLNYMLMPQDNVTIAQMTETAIDQVLSQCQIMKKELALSRPKFHIEDFRHLQLMLDIRINYLKFKQVEKLIESEKFDSSTRQLCIDKLKPVKEEGEKLRVRFNKLNKSYLKNPSVSYGIWDYITKMQKIYRCLTSQYH